MVGCVISDMVRAWVADSGSNEPLKNPSVQFQNEGSKSSSRELRNSICIGICKYSIRIARLIIFGGARQYAGTCLLRVGGRSYALASLARYRLGCVGRDMKWTLFMSYCLDSKPNGKHILCPRVRQDILQEKIAKGPRTKSERPVVNRQMSLQDISSSKPQTS